MDDIKVFIESGLKHTIKGPKQSYNRACQCYNTGPIGAQMCAACGVDHHKKNKDAPVL